MAAPNELVPLERSGDALSLIRSGSSGEPPPLRGRRKAAVLLVALGPTKAAEVFGHLSEPEIEELSLEMAKAGDIPREQIDEVLEEISRRTRWRSARSPPVGSTTRAKCWSGRSAPTAQPKSPAASRR